MNAGSDALRVVVDWVGALVVVGVGVVEVVVVLFVVALVVVVGCVSGGALAFVTVFVDEPHAESKAIADAHSAAQIA